MSTADPDPDPGYFVIDIYLKSGTVMAGVTVSDLNVTRSATGARTFSWTSADPNPLAWLHPDEVAGIVQRGPAVEPQSEQP